jgi:hypothetical protein
VAINAKQLKSIANELSGLVSVESLNNLSPVFQTPIDQHVGIQIEGEFKTNDSSDEGKMSYITIKRSRNIAVPFDGYGIAWRKGDGSKYNVYIVDNDALNSDVFVNEEQIWDQTGGTNQFLAAAAKEILINTWYKFVIKIYSANGMDVWIEKVDSFPSTLLPENRVVYRGQTYPPYVTQSAGEHFGLGVIETANSEWWYSKLKITSIVENYPMHLFKLKCNPENFSNGEELSLTYKGIGWGDEYNSLKWYVRNQSTADWELAGEISVGVGATSAEMTSVKSLTDITDYRDNENYVNILATPYNYLDDEHYLRSYYVGATNSLLSGIHTGNMVDVWIDSKSKIETTTQTIVMQGREYYFRTDSSFHMPIVDIVSVKRTLTSSVFEENVDYIIERPNQGKAFSTEDNIKLVFVDDSILGISLDIQYRYYSDGVGVQELMESDTFRYPGTSMLSKIMPYSIVKISKFDYRGSVAETVIQSALINTINNISDGVIEVSDLVNAAYTAGATYVNLSTISVSVKDQTYFGTYIHRSVDNMYTLTGKLKTFFADTVSIYGVNNE